MIAGLAWSSEAAQLACKYVSQSSMLTENHYQGTLCIEHHGAIFWCSSGALHTYRGLVLNVACQHVPSLQSSVSAGMACALLSGALFLLAATCLGMPVSTTHAIAGAVLGMTAAGAGFACIRWGHPGQYG